MSIPASRSFANIRAIRHSVNGVEARVLMGGETFEMEDQRNWSDGSYKTHCRPLSKPMPHELKERDLLTQSVRLELIGAGHLPVSGIPTPPLPIELDLEPAAGGQRVPQIGLAVDQELFLLSPASIAAIKELRPQHLRQ